MLVRESADDDVLLDVRDLETHFYGEESVTRALGGISFQVKIGETLGGMLRFVEHRVGDPRLISQVRRWLKAGVLEDGVVQSSEECGATMKLRARLIRIVAPHEEGTPQGGSISVLLIVKGQLRGEAKMVRYIDDFVICFQYREDALRVQEALHQRLGKFGLSLEPTKTKLVEFGRFAQRHAGKRGRNRPERTEKSRLKRSLLSLRELMRGIRHYKISDQVAEINRVLRGHYAYYGVPGNLRSLIIRSWSVTSAECCAAAAVMAVASVGSTFNQIKERNPLLRPKLRLPHRELKALAVL